MPLTPIRDELVRAQHGHYGVPLFDTIEMFGTNGIFAALEENRAPALVAIYSGLLERPGGTALASYVRTMAENASVPVSLALDHGTTYEQCILALSCGFTDVMYDGSKLPLEENIANTRLVVRAGHAVGATVEGELGLVGRGSDYQNLGAQRKGFTDPATAERFVAETGIDLLAVAIGSAHGMYDGEPQLDLALLREIRERVEIPLVMHGGSGLSDDQFRAAIADGISKINVFTDLALTAGVRMIEAAKADDASYFGIVRAAQVAFQERVGHFLKVFGACGRV